MNEFSHKKVTELAVKDLFSEGMLKEIVASSVLPDIDENDSGYVHHFYNPVSYTNYRGDEDSAKSRCIVHFAKYILLRKTEELGRAIHFLEDICTPVHVQYEDASDTIIRGPLHLEYEKELGHFCQNMLLSYTPQEYFERQKESFPNKNMSIGELIDFCALKAAKTYYEYRDGGKYLAQDALFQETLDLALFAVRYLVTIIRKQIITSKFVTDKNKKDVGMLLVSKFDDGLKIFDVAPLSSSYKLRTGAGQSIMVFHKSGPLRNYQLVNVLEE